MDDLAMRIPRFPCPARLEQFPELEVREGVSFGVEDDFVEGEDVCGAEEEVEVFKCFCLFCVRSGQLGFSDVVVSARGMKEDRGYTYQPETLHVISRWRRDPRHIVYTGESAVVLEGSMYDE